MKRVIGLDIGLKRIGVALSDPFLITASPKGYIENDDRVLENIKKLLEEYQTNDVVVGLPLTLRGNEGEQAVYTRQFVERLKKEVPQLNVVFVDERFTSSLAQKHLNPKKVKNKGEIDSMSAVFILQTYLDSLSFR